MSYQYDMDRAIREFNEFSRNELLSTQASSSYYKTEKPFYYPFEPCKINYKGFDKSALEAHFIAVIRIIDAYLRTKKQFPSGYNTCFNVKAFLDEIHSNAFANFVREKGVMGFANKNLCEENYLGIATVDMANGAIQLSEPKTTSAPPSISMANGGGVMMMASSSGATSAPMSSSASSLSSASSSSTFVGHTAPIGSGPIYLKEGDTPTDWFGFAAEYVTIMCEHVVYKHIPRIATPNDGEVYVSPLCEHIFLAGVPANTQMLTLNLPCFLAMRLCVMMTHNILTAPSGPGHGLSEVDRRFIEEAIDIRLKCLLDSSEFLKSLVAAMGVYDSIREPDDVTSKTIKETLDSAASSKSFTDLVIAEKDRRAKQLQLELEKEEERTNALILAGSGSTSSKKEKREKKDRSERGEGGSKRK